MTRRRWRLGESLDALEAAPQPERPQIEPTASEAALALKAALARDDALEALRWLGAGRMELELWGQSPLEVACEFGAGGCVKALLDGGEPLVAGPGSKGLAVLALRSGSQEAARALMDGARARGFGADLARGLAIEALRMGANDAWALSLLGEPGAFEDEEEKALAMGAALEGSGAMELLSRGWDPKMEVESSGGWRQSAVEAACEAGKWDACVHLLRHGGELPGRRWRLPTPALSMAARAGEAEAVEALLRAGAAVDRLDQERRSALSRAANERTAKLLLDFGADAAAELGGLGGWREVAPRPDALDWASVEDRAGAIVAIGKQIDPRGRVNEENRSKALGLRVGPLALAALSEASRAWDALDEASEIEALIKAPAARSGRARL